MPKFYKKFYRGPKVKYSVEQQAGRLDIPAQSQAWVEVVPDSDTEGMRKVKHITVSLASPDESPNLPYSHWALVYLPQGYAPNTMNIAGGSMYEPNQFVMNCGVCDFNAGPCRISSPLSRNLNSGDRIILILSNHTTGAHTVAYVVRYAVTLH